MLLPQLVDRQQKQQQTTQTVSRLFMGGGRNRCKRMQICSSTGSCLDTESWSWELQAAASQLPWQQQLTPAVTKRKRRKIATIEALPNLILTLFLRVIQHHLHPSLALIRRLNLFKPANGICCGGQSLPKQRICPFLTQSYQQARCPTLKREEFQSKEGRVWSFAKPWGLTTYLWW